MKTTLLILAVATSLSSVAQTKKPASKPASTTKTSTASKPAAKPVADTKARYPNGDYGLQGHFMATENVPIKYKRGFQGDSCTLQLSISASGKVTKAVVIKPTNNCPECDSAYVKRALQLSTWKPAISKGKAVASKQNFTIFIGPEPMEVEMVEEPVSRSTWAEEGETEVFDAPAPREVSMAKDSNTPLDFPAEPAEFPGGAAALQKFLQDNIKYPATALEAGTTGRVYLRFIVATDGTISDVELQRGLATCPECGKEAVRVVKSMPKWKPARDKGKEVRSYYNLPIKFEIPQSEKTK